MLNMLYVYEEGKSNSFCSYTFFSSKGIEKDVTLVMRARQCTSFAVIPLGRIPCAMDGSNTTRCRADASFYPTSYLANRLVQLVDTHMNRMSRQIRIGLLDVGVTKMPSQATENLIVKRM